MEHQLKPRNQRSDVAFVLGNGKSRLNVDPRNFQERGVVYGCNALYREFVPDYLVAVDVKMVNEYNTPRRVIQNSWHTECFAKGDIHLENRDEYQLRWKQIACCEK